MNNEFLKMQKLAGLITEGQYKANLNEMSEETLVSTLKENGFEVSSNPAWIVRNSETGDDYILYTESGDYISHKLDGDFPEGVKIMGEGADDWLEQFLETEKKTELNEESSNVGIPKSLVSKYVNMKSLFGNKAKDPMVKAKLIPIVTEFFPKNLDISYQDLKNEFGEEAASQTITVLFGAYLDGYLDRFQNPISRLFREKEEDQKN